MHYFQRTLCKLMFLVAVAIAMTSITSLSTALALDAQVVTVDPAVINETVSSGVETFTIDLNYTTNPVNVKSIAPSIWVHYNSSQLEYINFTPQPFDVHGGFNLGTDPAVADDTADDDSNPDTDKKVVIPYFSTTATWPNKDGQFTLITLEFKAIGEGNTPINIIRGTGGAGTDFNGTGSTVTISPPPDTTPPTVNYVRANGSDTTLTIPQSVNSILLETEITDVGTGDSDIEAAEYFIDPSGTPAGGTGTAMTPDTALDSPTESFTSTVDTSTWTAGDTRVIKVRGKDKFVASGNGGNWSDFDTVTVNVVASEVSSTASTFTVAPASGQTANDSDVYTFTVTALKSDGTTPVANASVVLAVDGDGTGTTFAPATGTTDASGVATITMKSSKAGTFTVNATVDGVLLTTTRNVTFDAGAAAKLVLSSSSPDILTSTNDTVTIFGTVKDANDNVVESYSTNITFTIAPTTYAAFSGGATETAAPSSGVAQAVLTSVQGSGTGTITVTGASGTLTQEPATFTINAVENDLYDVVISTETGGTAADTSYPKSGETVYFKATGKYYEHGTTTPAPDKDITAQVAWSVAPTDKGAIAVQDIGGGNMMAVFTANQPDAATITADAGSGITDTTSLTVMCDASAAFTADTSNGFEVTFDTSNANGTLSWDYGDTTTGTTDSHTYTAAGPYTVELTATGSGTPGCVVTETRQINVTCNAVASFTADTSNGFTVSFDATASTGTLAWDFGDTATEGDVTQPSHTYASAGFYTVELTATGGGSCTTTATQVIEIKCDATAKFTASPQILDLNGAASVSASFTNLSTGAAVDGSTATWSWDTDGDTTEDSTLKTPPDQDFATVGKYNASLTATGTSCSTDYIVPILVNDSSACSVTAGFTVAGNKTTIEINESLDFTNTSQNADTYAWDFDNDGTDDSTNAGFDPTPESHSYGAVGEYYAVLTATDSTATPAACSAYASKMITVICDVRAAFTSPASAEVGSPVTFTNTSEGTGVAAAGTTWEWDLDGDGTIDSTAKSPQKTYTAEGTYDVKLIATSAAGCITSETATITITVPVVEVTANFTYSPAEPKANAPVAFTDQSTTTAGLTITGWAWDFGDGSTSTDKNPTHTFTEEKTYAVKLVVTADNGRKASTERSIAVLAPEVDADFSSAPSTGNEPLEVTFTDKSTGLNLNSWSWTFGDGGTSTDQNPVHKYTDTGIFNVVLSIANSTGATDIVQKTVVVLVNDIIQIEAKFEAATDELKAVFTDKSTISKGEIKSWNWDFGGEGTSTEQNPTFTFPADGTYTVKLTVADQDGNKAEVTEDVTVEEKVVITAAFGVATSDLKATFTDMSTINKGNITSWSWMFGNDGTSTEQNPVHTFSADGTYAVKLTVADGNGNQDDVTKDVTVKAQVDPPVLKADFTADKTEGDIPLTVTFTDASTAENDTITNWAWNFGDGSTAEDTEGKPQTHTYNIKGTFYAELTITGASGGGDTKVMEITANDPGSVCPDCPEAPTPVAPADGSTISIMAPELQVESSTEAKSTKWQISDNTNFSVLLWAETNDKFTFQVPELLLAPNTTYYWRARFINEANKESVWSTVFHFTTPETDPDDQSGSGVPDDQDVDDPETIFPDVPDNEKTIFIKSAKGDITFAVEGIEEVLAILSGKAYSGDDVTPPENVTFDWGFVQFKAQLNGNGKTAKFKLHFSEKLPDGKTVKWYLKVGDELTDFSDYVTVSEDGKSAIIEITDGDFGDLDGLENGYILHMIGMGFTTVPSGGDGGGGGNTCFIQSLAGGVSSSIVIWLSLLSGAVALVWGRKRQ